MRRDVSAPAARQQECTNRDLHVEIVQGYEFGHVVNVVICRKLDVIIDDFNVSVLEQEQAPQAFFSQRMIDAEEMGEGKEATVQQQLHLEHRARHVRYG